MSQFPFSLPPYYISLIRCLGVLEGLAIQVEPEFRIVSQAYPYISSRLLTDSSPELEAALRQLLFLPEGEGTPGQARWDRLEQLLGQASETADYDAALAVDKLVTYLLSPGGASIRGQLVAEVIQGADELGAEAMHVLEKALLAQRLPTEDDLATPRLATLTKLANALASPPGSVGKLEIAKFLPVLQRVSTEPISRQAGIDIAAAVAERAISRGIRRLFALPEGLGAVE